MERSYSESHSLRIVHRIIQDEDAEGQLFLCNMSLVDTNGTIQSWTYEKPYGEDSSESSMVLSAIALSLLNMQKSGIELSRMRFILGDKYIADCLKYHLPRWLQSNWKTKRGTEVKDKELWQQISLHLRNRKYGVLYDPICNESQRIEDRIRQIEAENTRRMFRRTYSGVDEKAGISSRTTSYCPSFDMRRGIRKQPSDKNEG